MSRTARYAAARLSVLVFDSGNIRHTGFENAGEDHDRLLRAGSDNLVTYFCASLVPDFS